MKFISLFFLKNVITFVLLCFSFSVVAQKDSLETVIAEKGEGIYALLRKKGVNPYETFDAFVALNIDNIRDSIHVYEGRTYKIPNVEAKVALEETKKAIPNVLPKTGKGYAIFGKKYRKVPIKSSKLKNAVFYLVAGHGGPDPGAMATYAGKPIAEDEYAYDITLRLARELISHGALVYIIIRDNNDGIRDKRILKIDHDEVAYQNKVIPLNQVARLKQRVDIVNELYTKHKGQYQRLIVTHVDSRSKGQNIDVFFYHHEKSKSGKNLAENIHKTFQKKYKKYQPNRTYSGTFEHRTELYMVRKTWPAMTFIEIGNIRNKKDQKRILEPDNRQALAKWISEGAILDFQKR
ncbi:N-acetylmuramoyl-L-alanine amidase [Maribacter vaceletii]|uniref:N-acetylmuramoyl-L-alanine amidase n=1 Tax=Maribacter vaceletii TaxID=1206816 RepID=A0A495EE65_9FLAO|nr:N-acetylmuramoyl-L-alanine amidase [Maribacter vaceletii]RKR15184.1 N-acetylmuramoyl-L-alanine amidase [Maribacter vaceletii]